MIAICTNQFFIVFWPRSYLYCSISIGLNAQPFQVVNYLLLATNSLRRVLFLFYLQLRLQSCTFVVSAFLLVLDTTHWGGIQHFASDPRLVRASISAPLLSSSDVIGDLLTRLLFSPTFLYMDSEHYERQYYVHISTTGAKKI